MSVYNGERYLRESVESILNQTFKDFEFIIINDGSTDKTEEILNSYKDGRLRIFNQPNQGLTRSLNKALRFAQGEYIARQDADDISLPKRIGKQVEFLDIHKDIAVLGTFARIINELGCVVGDVIQFPEIEPEKIGRRLYFGNYLAHPTVMYRSSVIKKLGGYNEDFEFSQDYELWLRVIEGGYGIVSLPEYLSLYRRHDSQKSMVSLKMQTKYGYLARELAIEKGLKKAKDKDSKAWLLFARGVFYYEQERYKKAMEEFNKALSLQNNDPDLTSRIMLYKGMTYLACQRYDKAEEQLSKALSLNPPDKNVKIDILIHLGNVYSQQGKFKKAEDKLKNTLSLGPEDKNIICSLHYALGSNYKREELFDKAKEKFEEVIKIAKEIPSTLDKNRFVGGAHFHLGQIYQSQGNLKEAKVEFEECLRYNPEHRKAKEFLERLLRANHTGAEETVCQK